MKFEKRNITTNFVAFFRGIFSKTQHLNKSVALNSQIKDKLNSKRGEQVPKKIQ